MRIRTTLDPAARSAVVRVEGFTTEAITLAIGKLADRCSHLLAKAPRTDPCGTWMLIVVDTESRSVDLPTPPSATILLFLTWMALSLAAGERSQELWLSSLTNVTRSRSLDSPSIRITRSDEARRIVVELSKLPEFNA